MIHLYFEQIDNPQDRSQAETVLEDLSQLCPSDAFIKCHVIRRGNQFLVEMKVASSTAFMHAFNQAAAIGDSLSGIKNQMMEQILFWRSTRFQHSAQRG